MERSLKYFLSIALISFLATSCGQPYPYYKKSVSKEQDKKFAEELASGAGNYYQGSVGNMLMLYEAAKYDTNSATINREIGVPFLKRGFPVEFYKYYAESANIDPLNWQGWRGYLYLYFYRDYERALIDFDATDVHTPDFVDYPQSLSVDYMRAICYYYLDQPKKAIAYIEKHIKLETKTVGRKYIDSKSFVLLALSHQALGDYWEAEKHLLEGLEYDDGLVSILYYLSEVNYQLGRKKEGAKYLKEAQSSLDRGIVYNRNYVDEFFSIYQEDIDRLREKYGEGEVE
ncbi:tetratricopeptide repeat protein [Saprospiraceae bacterium]|nr:tetratricopeptide repeat protein [Saprospiraceae bacterium]